MIYIIYDIFTHVSGCTYTEELFDVWRMIYNGLCMHDIAVPRRAQAVNLYATHLLGQMAWHG